MKNSQVITDFETAQNEHQKKHGKMLLDAINYELLKLEFGETIKLSSPISDGNCIPTFNYSDHINIIHKNGICPIWNNNDCEGEHVHDDAVVDANVNLITLAEILKCCVAYNKKKEEMIMTDSDYENLDVILKSIDPDSDLDVSLSKAIKILKAK